VHGNPCGHKRLGIDRGLYDYGTNPSLPLLPFPALALSGTNFTFYVSAKGADAPESPLLLSAMRAIHFLIPIVLSSCGGFGPSAQKYLKHVYGRARKSSSDMGVAYHSDHMEHAPRFHVPEHAPQRGWCRKGRAGPERHLAHRLHPQSRRGWPAALPRS
jgi:hypothetical protein